MSERSWRLGFFLSLCAVVCWGLQPLALGMLAKTMSPNAVAFYKAATAAIFFLAIAHKRVNVAALLSKSVVLIFASLGLAISYVTYNAAYSYFSPSNAQVYFQFSRVFLAFFGIAFLRESFVIKQWIGFGVLLLGLFLFFRNQLPAGGIDHMYYLGVGLILISALAWAIYAALQKNLAGVVSSSHSLAFIYVISTAVIVPYAHLTNPSSFSASMGWALFVVCLTNVAAYWFFAEALKYWEASRVGAVTCLGPIITIAMMAVVSNVFSAEILPSEHIGVSGLIGAAGVVIGSAAMALSR